MSTLFPQVSVGLPVYNGENYLEEALESIFEQTFSDFELIISDNASTDRTLEICQSYASRDERVRLYANETNVGASKNFNRVFELARGRYFKWAAHDDLLAPIAVEKCFSLLEDEPQAILSYPKTVLIDEKGDVIEYHEDHYDLRQASPHVRFRHFFHTSAWCHPVFGLVRTKEMAKTALLGNYPSSDRVLLGELAMRGKCLEVPEYLAFRRLHPLISTVANTTDEEVWAWFDPEAKFLAPRAKRVQEYLRAIRRSKLGFKEEILCYLELAKFYVSPRRLKGVYREARQLRSAVSHLRSDTGPEYDVVDPTGE